MQHKQDAPVSHAAWHSFLEEVVSSLAPPSMAPSPARRPTVHTQHTITRAALFEPPHAHNGRYNFQTQCVQGPGHASRGHWRVALAIDLAITRALGALLAAQMCE